MVDNISSLVAHINANRPVRKVVVLTHQGESNTDNSGTSKWIQPSGKEPGEALLAGHSAQVLKDLHSVSHILHLTMLWAC